MKPIPGLFDKPPRPVRKATTPDGRTVDAPKVLIVG